MEAIAAQTKQPLPAQEILQCYHCGETCDSSLSDDNHFFCCEGCKFVYGLLKENGLCNYYELSQTPELK
jgi:Cu+-exporting ATPase